jgi:glutamate N-acetyltransferase/amino-acid N-acetyltransferase
MSVTAASGFRAGAVAAGIKRDGLDLALIAASAPAAAAGVFTTMTTAAPPVQLSRLHLADGSLQAVILNSGCANAATGEAGLEAARATAVVVAENLGCLPDEVAVCSTGVIGRQLPVAKVTAAIPELVAGLAGGADSGSKAARAILTTDTVTKEAVYDAGGFTVGGMAKGAGMLRPDMATMLAIITTDALVPCDRLQRALKAAISTTFNSMNFDGCQSTNDSVLALASGDSHAEPDDAHLIPALTEVCRSLAAQMAADAEGAARVVTIKISGARDDATARALGRVVTDSALVRCSFHGGDPNWGRLLAALGASEMPFDPAATRIAYNGVDVARGGVAVPFDEEALLADLSDGDFSIAIDVGAGPGYAEILTVDLGPEYVRFNSKRS